ncbi:MAG: hypothetical protein ABSB95_11060 [Dissulfurispiraceae bacterium]|jgi:hypothetical protein
MSLQDKLDEYKKKFIDKLSKETLATMHNATDELRRSGIMERLLKPGSHAPDFELPNTNGRIITLAELMTHGSVVVSFYRGSW